MIDCWVRSLKWQYGVENVEWYMSVVRDTMLPISVCADGIAEWNIGDLEVMDCKLEEV